MPTINTITGQLARINSAANTIWNKASDMALRLPAGSYWDLISKSDKTITGVNLITGLDSPEAEYKIDGGVETYNFGIDAVAQAIWHINSRDYLEQNSTGTYISGNQDINEKTEIKIPVGYNKTEFKITAKSIGSQLTNTSATSKYLYKDKSAYIKNVSGEHQLITGNLQTVYLNNPLGVFNDNKINSNNGTLKVSLNSNALDEYLDTNIYYRDPEDDGVARTGSVTRDNKTYLAVDLLQGYYDKNIVTDIAYISGLQSKTVKINRYFNPDGTVGNKVNALTIPAGYYKDGLIVTPVFEDEGDIEEDILNIADLDLQSGPILTFNNNYPKVFKPANYGNGYDYFGQVIIPQAGISSENGLFKVTASGWVNKDDEFGEAYKTLTAGQVNVQDDWDATNKVITDRIFTIKVDQGYYSATAVTKEFTIKAGSHNLSVNFYNDNKFGGSTAITSGIENITKQYGKITDTIAAGWISGNNSSTYYRIQDWVRKGSTAKTADYYTVGTSGWISSNSDFKYVGNNINAGGIYNPVKAGTNLTIPAGTVLTNDLTVDKISVGEAEYVITKADLANTDGNTEPTKFTVEADSGYMTKITIDMIEILNELQKI